MVGLRKRRRLALAAVVLVVLAAAFSLYGYWEAGQVRVVERELFFDDLPAAFDGFRIIQLADLHTRAYGRVEQRLRRLLQATPADLLVVVGDFKAHLATPDALVHASLERTFGSIEYPWGIVACPGNHDTTAFYFELADRGRFLCLLRSSLLLEWRGGRVALLGTATTRPLDGGRGAHEIDECSWVGNVASRGAPRRVLPDGDATARTCDLLSAGKMFRILIAHTPDHIVAAAREGIDLVLAGDTHGGQIRLPLIGSPFSKSWMHYKYDWGHFVRGRTQMVVTPGVGTLYVPIRFLCPPEVTVLILRRKAAEKKIIRNP